MRGLKLTALVPLLRDGALLGNHFVSRMLRISSTLFASLAWALADNNLRLPRRYRGVCGVRALGRRNFAAPKDAARPSSRRHCQRGKKLDQIRGTLGHDEARELFTNTRLTERFATTRGSRGIQETRLTLLVSFKAAVPFGDTLFRI